MRAIRIHAFGGVDRLQLEQVADPTAGVGEVVVALAATSLNPVDSRIRRGDLGPRHFPLILGEDFSGRVISKGPSVISLELTARVMGIASQTYAERVVVKASDLCPIPQGLGFEQAAAIPFVTLAGAQLIENAGGVARGQLVLVTGALGSVGRAAVFVAKRHGAHVFAGVRRQRKQQAATLGVEAVVALDDPAEVSKLPALDVLADTVGEEVIGPLLPKLRRGGKLATSVGIGNAIASRPDLQVETLRTRLDAHRLSWLAEDVAAGRLKIPIAKVFAFDAIQEAHRFAERHPGGKVVIVPNAA